MVEYVSVKLMILIIVSRHDYLQMLRDSSAIYLLPITQLPVTRI